MKKSSALVLSLSLFSPSALSASSSENLASCIDPLLVFANHWDCLTEQHMPIRGNFAKVGSSYINENFDEAVFYVDREHSSTHDLFLFQIDRYGSANDNMIYSIEVPKKLVQQEGDLPFAVLDITMPGQEKFLVRLLDGEYMRKLDDDIIASSAALPGAYTGLSRINALMLNPTASRRYARAARLRHEALMTKIETMEIQEKGRNPISSITSPTDSLNDNGLTIDQVPSHQILKLEAKEHLGPESQAQMEQIFRNLVQCVQATQEEEDREIAAGETDARYLDTRISILKGCREVGSKETTAVVDSVLAWLKERDAQEVSGVGQEH